MKKGMKRLALNAETLRDLDAQALRSPAGGLSQTGCTTKKPPCEQSFNNPTCLC